MKVFISSGYNLLALYPTGDNPKAQAELCFNFQETAYTYNQEGELVKVPQIETIRFVSEAEQLEEIAKELTALALKLRELQEGLSVKTIFS